MAPVSSRKRSDDDSYTGPDYSDWMGQLPDETRCLPVCRLSIPGSHDSFTYSLVRSGAAGPDQPSCVRWLTRKFPSISSKIIYRWGRTQWADLAVQLRGGVRYFDIRLDAVMEEGETHYRVLHCLLGLRIVSVLIQLKEFLDKHPGEVLILDFQHQYQFQDADHLQLANIIMTHFQGRMHPWTGEAGLASLRSLQESGHRVIVIYPRLDSPLFWPRKFCPNPWPETTHTDKLRSSLVDGVEKRDISLLFVSQGVLTPTTLTVALHPFSGLRKACGERANKTVLGWLETLEKEGVRPNILITDFVMGDSTSCQIMTWILERNREETSKTDLADVRD